MHITILVRRGEPELGKHRVSPSGDCEQTATCGGSCADGARGGGRSLSAQKSKVFTYRLMMYWLENFLLWLNVYWGKCVPVCFLQYIIAYL